MISTTTGPRSATQRKRQRLDQLVGRIAHLVGSAPIGRISSSSHNSGCGPVAKNKNRNNNIRSSNNIHNNNNNNNNNNSGETEDGENERRGRICVSLSEEEEEEDEEEEDDDEEGSVSVSMESSVGSGESPSPQQQAVLSMSRLRMRGNMRHLHHHHHQFHHHHLHPHHGGGQVFSFDHVMPVMAAMAGSAAMCSQSQSDEEGEEEVFSPGLGLTPTFSDRLTLSPCSQSSTTVDSPSGISFSPLSFADCGDDAVGARGITRSLTSDPSTPLNLSTGGSRGSHHHAGVTPPNASSSPCHAGATKRCNTVGSSSDVEPNRRRARSDSDLCDTDRLVEDGRSHHHHHPMVAVAAAAAPASWVLTPATSSSLTSPPLSTGSSQHSSGHLAPRLSRLEHLRPPPLMVSLKRNSSDSTDSWSPLFGQQESPVDLSVRSGSSISSDSPNQTSTNTSTASVSSAELSMFSGSGGGGLETPPPPTSSRVGKSRGSRLKVLTRSLSLSQYLSAEYSSSSVDLSGPDSESVSPIMTTPLLLPGSNLGFGCEICGQVFDHHDRLIKHLTSRHKLPVQQQHQQHHHHQQQQTATIPPPPPPPTTPRSLNGSGESGVVVKGYQCDVCQRPFARSDMLTRHMRLHTGLKPYTCRICGQVFSRSDHLSTHQRTHTGEKPYRCPQCSYAACRRDMITRHLRTHTRSEDLDGLNDPRKDSG